MPQPIVHYSHGTEDHCGVRRPPPPVQPSMKRRKFLFYFICCSVEIIRILGIKHSIDEVTENIFPPEHFCYFTYSINTVLEMAFTSFVQRAADLLQLLLSPGVFKPFLTQTHEGIQETFPLSLTEIGDLRFMSDLSDVPLRVQIHTMLNISSLNSIPNSAHRSAMDATKWSKWRS